MAFSLVVSSTLSHPYFYQGVRAELISFWKDLTEKDSACHFDSKSPAAIVPISPSLPTLQWSLWSHSSRTPYKGQLHPSPPYMVISHTHLQTPQRQPGVSPALTHHIRANTHPNTLKRGLRSSLYTHFFSHKSESLRSWGEEIWRNEPKNPTKSTCIRYSQRSILKYSKCHPPAQDSINNTFPRRNRTVLRKHWRRKWQPTPIFLPGEFPRTEEPGRLQSMGLKESDKTEQLSKEAQGG